VIASGPDPAVQLSGLDDPWFLNYSSKPLAGVVSGRQVIYITSVDPVPIAQITRAAVDFPAGSVWYVLGEPNVGGPTGADAVVGLHDTYALIKSLDPTALITSPSLLNFSFTCIGCNGYTPGETWADDFRTSYDFLYGVAPPVDIWAIDTFPIAWGPAEFPTVKSNIVIDQVTELRDYLDAIPGQAGKPIWVTEFGLHWGYTNWTQSEPACSGLSYPVGEYQTESVKQYLREVYEWLESNAVSKNIGRWFTFSSFRDLSACHADGGYGLTLYEQSGGENVLTEIGQFYLDWTHGIR